MLFKYVCINAKIRVINTSKNMPNYFFNARKQSTFDLNLPKIRCFILSKFPKLCNTPFAFKYFCC